MPSTDDKLYASFLVTGHEPFPQIYLNGLEETSEKEVEYIELGNRRTSKTKAPPFEGWGSLKGYSDGKGLVGDVGEAYLYWGFVGFGYLEHCARL